MIRITDEPNDGVWDSWKLKAQHATDELVSLYGEGREVVLDEHLYKEQRLALLQAFHNKCGYCEVLITAADHLGDIEHYRPKGRVTDESGKLVFIDAARSHAHPGYFWLAYKWDNMFPACIACNRPGSGPNGVKSGKWDCFPVAGFRATNPGEEINEAPILLNPWLDDPSEHLVFDAALGILGCKTERGKETIRILGLNRDGLIELRQKAIRAIKLEFRESQQAFQRADHSGYQNSVATIRQCLSGEAQFSAVCRAAVMLEKRRSEEFLAEL